LLGFLKKKAPFVPGYFPVNTDMHSHILPGIDDGSPDIATSLLLIRQMYKLGIRKAIATPHIIGDTYPNNATTIKKALQIVQQACKAAKIKMDISAAAEYMLDDYFVDLLHKKVPLLCLHKNILLTEFSYNTAPPGVEQMYLNITSNGYLPVLAHPERYHYFQKDYDQFFMLAETGYKLQVNLLSLTGYYGQDAAKAGKFIIENNLANLVGTDMHHQQHANALMNANNKTVIHSILQGKMYNDLNSLTL
jgi:tyrosine-protein phosphatase YwqE